jgi:hypothetical protein
MDPKFVFALISRKYHTDGGDIYFNKHLAAIDEKIKLYYLNECNQSLAFFINIFSNKYILFISRLPYGSFIYLKTIKLIAYYLVKMSSFRNYFKSYSTIIIPTGDFFVFEIAIQLKLVGVVKNIHLSMLDFPWTYNNLKVNNFYIKKYFLRNTFLIDSADFISEAMCEFMNQYNNRLKGIVIYPLVDLLNNKNTDLFKNNFNESKSALKVVFAGNLRFKKEIIHFVDNLSKINTSIEFHLFSETSIQNKSIINHNFISSFEVLKSLLSDMDFGFIPMSFNKKDKELVETSFPSKLAMYLSIGLPVIVYAPKYSMISKFVIKHNLGLVLDHENLMNFNKKEIVVCTKKIFDNSLENLILETTDNYKQLKKLLRLA